MLTIRKLFTKGIREEVNWLSVRRIITIEQNIPY